MKPKNGKKISSNYDRSSERVYQFLKQKEEIQQLCLRGKVFEAWEKTEKIVEALPPSTMKEQLIDEIQTTNCAVQEIVESSVLPILDQYEFVKNLQDKQKGLLNDAIPKIWAKLGAIITEE